MFRQALPIGLVVAGGMLSFISQTAQASLITINNYSFENATGSQAQASGLSDWVAKTTVSPSGWPAAVVTSVSSGTHTGMDGNNTLSITMDPGTSPTGSTIVAATVTTVSLGTYQPNTVYTLTVALGAAANQAHHFDAIAMSADGVVAASLAVPFSTLNPTHNASTFVLHDYQAVLDTSIATDVIGKSITVQLAHQVEAGGQYYKSAVFDNVRLDATTTIPEPATMALLAVGGLVTLRRRSVR